MGLSTVAIYKWLAKGRLPRTEWTGETRYAQQIEALCAGAVTAQQLLGPWPKWPADPPSDCGAGQAAAQGVA